MPPQAGSSEIPSRNLLRVSKSELLGLNLLPEQVGRKMLEGTEVLLYHRKLTNEDYFFLKMLPQHFVERNDPVLSVLNYVAVRAFRLAILVLKELVEVGHGVNEKLPRLKALHRSSPVQQKSNQEPAYLQTCESLSSQHTPGLADWSCARGGQEEDERSSSAAPRPLVWTQKQKLENPRGILSFQMGLLVVSRVTDTSRGMWCAKELPLSQVWRHLEPPDLHPPFAGDSPGPSPV